MFLSETQRQVLRALRAGPLGQMDIAAEIGEAPYLVRGVLKQLARERVVLDRFRAGAYVWELTGRGWDATLAEDQLRLGGPAA